MVNPTGALICFTAFIFCFSILWHTECSISRPSRLQRSSFVNIKDRKSNTQLKYDISNIESRISCEIECVRRMGCSSYDFLERENKKKNICEINFNSEQNQEHHLIQEKRWIHGQKQITKVEKRDKVKDENFNHLAVGKFERRPVENNWHIVTITYHEPNNQYIWENAAGRKWSLYPTENENELRVGEDCPYYSHGYTIAEITNEEVYGVGRELYWKLSDINV